jgi:hypothetical protein
VLVVCYSGALRVRPAYLVAQVLRGQMPVPHGHREQGMVEHLLERPEAAAAHDVDASERARIMCVPSRTTTIRFDTLLDHLVGASQQGGRDRQSERLGALHVHDQLELRRLLHRL